MNNTLLILLINIPMWIWLLLYKLIIYFCFIELFKLLSINETSSILSLHPFTIQSTEYYVYSLWMIPIYNILHIQHIMQEFKTQFGIRTENYLHTMESRDYNYRLMHIIHVMLFKINLSVNIKISVLSRWWNIIIRVRVVFNEIKKKMFVSCLPGRIQFTRWVGCYGQWRSANYYQRIG